VTDGRTDKGCHATLLGYFGTIHMGTLHAKFQPSGFNVVGGGGDRRKDC